MTKISFIFAAGLLAWQTAAGPFDEAKVSADAKWVLHLDGEAFLKSELGRHIVEQILEPKLKKDQNLQKLTVNARNISSLTAYGPGFEKNGEGVLIIRTTADAKKDLDTLAGMAMLGGQNVITTTEGSSTLYNVNDDLFVSSVGGGTVLVAKSRGQIEAGMAVLAGKSKSLADTRALAELPKTPASYFFVGAAQGLQNAEVPPQAQVLRETSGGRLVVGEQGQDVVFDLALRGKDPEATTKVQQVLQGLVALVSMTQAENKELVALANSAKITSAERNVMVNLKFPVAKAIEEINEKHGISENSAGSDTSSN